MNLAQLRATLSRNRAPLAIAGAAIVGLLALRSRARGGSTPAPGTEGTTYPGTAGYSAGYQAAAATGYDSTASDVVGAVQPYLEHLQRLIEQQATDTPPTPVPDNTTAASTWGNERRDTIGGFYKTILGRDPALSEVNAWDATGESTEGIRSYILRSDEAKAAK